MKLSTIIFFIAFSFSATAQEIEKTELYSANNIKIQNGEKISLQLSPHSDFNDFDLSKISISGTMNTSRQNNKNIVKVKWTQLLNSETNKEIEIPIPLESAFAYKKEQVDSKTKVMAYGDKKQIDYILPQLFKNNKLKEEEAEEKKKERKSSALSSSNSMSDPISSDNNSDDLKYEEYAVKEEAEITFEYETCPNRVDLANLTVYPQSKAIEYKDGNQSSTGECNDSGQPMTIQFSYSECEPEVLLNEQKVYARKRAYYIENEEQKFLGECKRDPDKYYTIKENFSCSPLIDMSGKKVEEQSSLYYDDETGRSIVVSECQTRDTTRTFEMTTTYDTCSYRYDSEQNLAYQQEKYVYEKDGAILSVSSCADSEQTYPVELEFCSYKEDWQTQSVTRLSKSKISTVQGVFYLTDCVPEATGDIIETIDGCESLHTDYFEAKYSKGWSRFYHMDGNKRVYLTECAESTLNTYPHQLKVEDWEADLGNKTAVSLLTPYIDLSIGQIKLRNPQRYANDSVTVPLAIKKEETIGNGEFFYDGCDRYEGQKIETTYLLPNDEEIIKYTDISEKKYSAYVCEQNLEKFRIHVGTGWTCGSTHGCKRPQFVQQYVDLQRMTSYNNVTGELICNPWEIIAISSAGGNIASYPGYNAWGTVVTCGNYVYRPGEGYCNNGILSGPLDCVHE